MSNPPYLSQEVLAAAPAEVREHEPEMALLSADAGMATCIRIIREGFDWLAAGGRMVMETAGSSQWHDLSIWFGKRYEGVQITNDLAGRPRFAEGRKP